MDPTDEVDGSPPPTDGEDLRDSRGGADTSTDQVVVTPGPVDMDGVTSSTSTRSDDRDHELEKDASETEEGPGSSQPVETSTHSAELATTNDNRIAMETDGESAPCNTCDSSEAEQAVADSSGVCDGMAVDLEDGAQTNEVNEADSIVTIHLPNPATSDDHVDSSDHSQADVSAMELEQFELSPDSPSGLSQIKITCVQSVAADSLGIEDSEGCKSEDRQEDKYACPVTSQQPEVGVMETTSDGNSEPGQSTSFTDNAVATSSQDGSSIGTIPVAVTVISSQTDGNVSSSRSGQMQPDDKNLNQNSNTADLNTSSDLANNNNNNCRLLESCDVLPAIAQAQSSDANPRVVLPSEQMKTSSPVNLPHQEAGTPVQSKITDNSVEISSKGQDTDVRGAGSVSAVAVPRTDVNTTRVLTQPVSSSCLPMLNPEPSESLQVQVSKEMPTEYPEKKKSLISPKFSTYSLQKARHMLHSVLGTVPVSSNEPTQQINSMVEQAKAVVRQASDNKLEEQGDILDILKSHNSEAATINCGKKFETISTTGILFPERKQGKGGNQIAKKSTTKKPTIAMVTTAQKPTVAVVTIAQQPTVAMVTTAHQPNIAVVTTAQQPTIAMATAAQQPTIKQEPADSYNGYGGNESTNRGQGDSAVPSVVIENVQGETSTSATTPSSISLLSKQVAGLSKVGTNQQSASSTLSAKNTNLAVNSQLASKPATSGHMQINIAPKLLASARLSASNTNKLVPMVAGFGPASGAHRVTIHLANQSAPIPSVLPIPRLPVPHRAPRIIQPKMATRTMVQTITTPALLQTNATIRTTYPPPMPVSSINIDTVGLPRITELIARKNPIPNYKARPVPDSLKDVVKGETFLCYECGDTFSIQSSLNQHRGRYSMKITYKCDECNKEKCFFNKCQFLGHLRQHLNIEKTQAVPIHIKSDSIAIASLPKVYEPLIFQSVEPLKNSEEKPTEVVVKDMPSKKRCRECGIQLSVEEIAVHFNSASVICDFRNCCGICHMVLPSICALRTHRRLHSDLETTNCPECGKHFVKEFISSEEAPLDPKSAFIQHVRYECCHIGRITQMICPKCEQLLETAAQVKNHCLAQLDQYIKCQICPMAFRTSSGFEKHFVTHNKGKSHPRYYKRIYKCHICDSVMDDLSVLEVHIAGHITELKGSASYGFVCIHCRQIFTGKENLSKHFKEKHEVEVNKRSCVKCGKFFGTELECLLHDLLFHRSSPIPEYRICKMCSNVMSLDEFLSHPCNKKKTKEKFVCNFCNYEMPNKKNLRKHMEIHKRNGTPVCSMCFRTDFKNMHDLKNHEGNCSGFPGSPAQLKTENVQCEECKLQFPTKRSLDHHTAVTHPQLFPCHLCGDTYKTQDDLKHHVKVKHVAKRSVYPCQICNGRGIKKAFSSKVVLEKHLSCRHRKGRNPVISQKFITHDDEESGSTDNDKDEKDSAKRKIEEEDTDLPFKKLRVKGETRFTCAKCYLTSDDRPTFMKHLVQHKVENYIQCMECGLSFAVLPSLRKHLFMVHKVKDFDLYCCENGIEDKDDVDYDKEIKDIAPVPELEVKQEIDQSDDAEDEDRNPLECRVCHQVFESEVELRTHTRTHGMAFIRNKRRNKMVPASRMPLQMNGDADSDSIVSLE